MKQLGSVYFKRPSCLTLKREKKMEDKAVKTQPKVSSGPGEGHTGLHWLMIFFMEGYIFYTFLFLIFRFSIHL